MKFSECAKSVASIGKNKMKKIFLSSELMKISGVEILEIDAVDAVLFRMEQEGLKQADLIPLFGSRSRVSEFLSRKRPASVQVIRNLYFGLGIPAKVLMQYEKNKS